MRHTIMERTVQPVEGYVRKGWAPPLRATLSWLPGEGYAPYLFVAPFLLLFAAFTLYPLLYALVLSFTHWHGLGAARFIGLDNYIFLLTDNDFWGALANATMLWLLVVPAQTVLAVAAATVLSSAALRFRALYRIALAAPFVTPVVAMAEVWRGLLGTDYTGGSSPVNDLLTLLHLPSVGWLTTEEWARPALALFVIWKTFGFALVLMLVAVQTVPRELYEAAALDGAGAVTQFRRVTVPLVRRSIAFWVVVATLTVFQLAAEPHVLTNGGPYGATTTPGLLLYGYITNSDLGTGAAASFLLIALVLVLSLLALWLLRAEEDVGTPSANTVTAPPPRSATYGARPSLLVSYLILTLAAILFLYPFYEMVTSALTASADGTPPVGFDPRHVTLDNVVGALRAGPPYLLVGLKNTAIVVLTRDALTLFFCPLAGFAFAKYRFRGRNALFGIVLATLMLPVLVLIVPLFLEMNALGWVNTYQALILPGAIDAFGIFWMRQVIAGVSDELLDAGRIDGCSPFGLYRRIILPSIRPGLVALAIFALLTTYNDFLWPVIVVVTDEMQTLQLVLDNLPSSAAGALATLPVLVLFLLLQRPLMRGITTGRASG